MALMLLSLLEQGQIRGAAHTDKDLGRVVAPEKPGGFGKEPLECGGVRAGTADAGLGNL